MQFYNAHSHVFTMRNAPKKFLQLYLPNFAANAIDTITNNKAGSTAMSFLLSKLGGNWGKRYASFLSIGKSKDQLSVFETLLAQYSDNTTKFVALSMYMEKCGADVSESGFEGQLEELILVKKQYPDNLLIFMGIDPRWKYSGKELRQTVERYFQQRVRVSSFRTVYPFVGLKIYPSMGFYGFDEKLKETFEWAADNGVPVLSHCNYLGGIFNNDTSHVKSSLNPMDVYSGKLYADNFPGIHPPRYHENKNFFKKLLGTQKNDANLNTCSYFLEPAGFRTMINYFDKRPRKLKLCLAHFGGDAHILDEFNSKPANNLFGMVQQNWCSQIIDLMKEYPGVYTDISYAVSNENIHKPILEKHLNDPAYGDRILFGTDFFLTEREMPERNDYEVFREKAMAKRLTNFDNRLAWDQIASVNTDKFLASKYYDGTSI